MNPIFVWAAMARLVSEGGSVVIRVPNKSLLIHLGRVWYRFTHTRSQRLRQDRVRFFNPEHVLIFRQRFLRRRLMRGIQASAEPPFTPLARATGAGLTSAFLRLATKVNQLSRHTLVLTPSMVVVEWRVPSTWRVTPQALAQALVGLFVRTGES
jgi:hypothetical protein